MQIYRSEQEIITAHWIPMIISHLHVDTTCGYTPPINGFVYVDKGGRFGLGHECFDMQRALLSGKILPCQLSQQIWQRQAGHGDTYLPVRMKEVLVLWTKTIIYSCKIKWSNTIGISRAHAWICLLFCCSQWNKNHIRISNHCRNTFEASRLRSYRSKQLTCSLSQIYIGPSILSVSCPYRIYPYRPSLYLSRIQGS